VRNQSVEKSIRLSIGKNQLLKSKSNINDLIAYVIKNAYTQTLAKSKGVGRQKTIQMFSGVSKMLHDEAMVATRKVK